LKREGLAPHPEGADPRDSGFLLKEDDHFEGSLNVEGVVETIVRQRVVRHARPF